MAERVSISNCSTLRLTVRHLRRVTPRVTRMVAGGPGLLSYDENGFTDAYIQILFPKPGVGYPEDFDMRWIRARLPREQWPRTRTYTVRSFDRVPGELAIDFFDHGQPGLARSWLAALSEGDDVYLEGPGGEVPARPGRGLAPPGG